MLDELAREMGFNRTEIGIYQSEDGTKIRFQGETAFVTQKFNTESDGEKISLLTYAMGELENARLVVEKDNTYFLPNHMQEYHTRVVVVHYVAPLASICRPIAISRIKYDPEIIAPQDLYTSTIENMVRTRFKSPEVKFLFSKDNYSIYLATSYDEKEATGDTEVIWEMFKREPKNELEGAIIAELKKTHHVEDQQQIYNTLLHEESHPAHLPDA